MPFILEGQLVFTWLFRSDELVSLYEEEPACKTPPESNPCDEGGISEVEAE